MKRKYLPGSEWLYFKIYISRSFSEKLLTKDLSQTLDALLKDDHINSFFFIRYGDPHYHIRLRCKINDLNNYGLIVNKFNKKFEKLVEQDIIANVQIDTYERELERYNKLLIEDSESLFYVDSLYCLKLLKLVKSQDLEDYKWKICIINVLSYMELFFGEDINKKFSLIKQMSISFKSEFGFNENNSKNFNQLFRDKQGILENLFDLEQSKDDTLKKIASLVRKRDSQLKPIVHEVNHKCNINNLNVEALISSYIHMSINRMIPSLGRMHELVIYDNLTRMYGSIIARQKHGIK